MKRKYLFLIIAAGILFLLDTSPILYYKIINPRGTIGSWPVFFNYENTKPKELLNSIDNLNSENLVIKHDGPSEKYIPGRKGGEYQKIILFDKEKEVYYHVFVLTDSLLVDNYTQIVFCYVSNSLAIANAKCINRDYDYMTNLFIINRFKKLIINNLKNVNLSSVY